MMQQNDWHPECGVFNTGRQLDSGCKRTLGVWSMQYVKKANITCFYQNRSLDCVGRFGLNGGIRHQRGTGVAHSFAVKAVVHYEFLTAVLVSALESRFKFTL